MNKLGEKLFDIAIIHGLQPVPDPSAAVLGVHRFARMSTDSIRKDKASR